VWVKISGKIQDESANPAKVLVELPFEGKNSMDYQHYPLRDKVILVTGATNGIGAATARQLYALGGRVILHGRNPVLLESAISSILKETPGSPGWLDFLAADFTVMQQVYAMAEAFKQRYDRLDVLINNAGAVYLRRQETPDGLEKTFAVNHLAPFLLTRQLMDILKASSPARVIVVSSAAHFEAALDFNDLQLKKKYRALTAYANSKLCNILFAYELARRFRRMPDIEVVSNAVHPGLVASGFAKNNGAVFRLGVPVFQWFARLRKSILTTDESAETLVYLAEDPQAAAFSGKYIVNKKQEASSVQSYDHDLAAHLWGVSEVLLQGSVPALKAQAEAKSAALASDSQAGYVQPSALTGISPSSDSRLSK